MTRDLEVVEKERILWKANEEKYKKIYQRHYQIIEKIKFDLYPKTINEKNAEDKNTFECIKLCYDDLSLAPMMVEYWKKDAEIRKEKYVPLNYCSHKYLIMLLIKLGQKEEALKVCNYYINLGLYNDGTKGGLIARKEKILKS